MSRKKKLTQAQLDLQAKAAGEIRKSYKDSQKLLSDFPMLANASTRYRVEKLKNGAVDGLLRVYDIPRNYSIRQVLFDLEAAMQIPSLDGVYISIGFVGQFDPERGEYQTWKNPPKAQSEAAKYDRYKGQDRIDIRPQVASQKAPYNFVTARDMAEKLRSYRRYKPDEVVIRYYWAATQKPPKRKDRKK